MSIFKLLLLNAKLFLQWLGHLKEKDDHMKIEKFQDFL